MRVLACGSRTWTARGAIEDALREIENTDPGPYVLIHGAARGADRLAEEVAAGRAKWGVLSFPANWKKYGNMAGPLRNKQMLVEGKPDVVLAFWDGESRGTKNMIELSRQAKVPVKIYSPTHVISL